MATQESPFPSRISPKAVSWPEASIDNGTDDTMSLQAGTDLLADIEKVCRKKHTHTQALCTHE